MNAALVIGQNSFTTFTRATSQNGLGGPAGIAFDALGNLWVADPSNARVLRYPPPFTDGMPADLVIGQNSFTTGTPATSQNGLWNPVGIVFDKQGNLWVADPSNNRVLRYPPPFTDGMPAYCDRSGSGQRSTQLHNKHESEWEERPKSFPMLLH